MKKNNLKKQNQMRSKNSKAFTIVELLIVVVVIAVLAAISVVSYNGIQTRTRHAQMKSDISQIAKQLEIYKIQNNNSYPVSSAGSMDYTSWTGRAHATSSSNCMLSNATDEWIPGIGVEIPTQPRAVTSGGGYNLAGCYLYASDGETYVLSAWNMLEAPEDESDMYRRIGFRELFSSSSNPSGHFVMCNHSYIGGIQGGTYNVNNDMYKRSYTKSNITSCDETPPSGA